MSPRLLRIAALLFAVVALVAAGLQFAAYLHTDWPRHLILAIFAASVGVSVAVAAVRLGRG